MQLSLNAKFFKKNKKLFEVKLKMNMEDSR